MAEYCLLTLPLSLITIEGFRARRVNSGKSTLQTLHSEGKFLEIKLFLTSSLKGTRSTRNHCAPLLLLSSGNSVGA